MQVTITKIAKFTKSKDGTPLTTKAGRPYTSLRFQCNEYGAKWVSGFENADNRNWKEGDTVEVTVEEKGEYLNFSTPKMESKNVGTNPEVIRKLDTIITELAIMKPMLKDCWNQFTSDGKPAPTFDESELPPF